METTIAEALGGELLGRVLASLPRDDLEGARLACRAFDRASRAHSGRFSSLVLWPDDCIGPCPDWARFPQLRRLDLRGWRPKHNAALRALCDGASRTGGAGGLRGLEEVDAATNFSGHGNDIDAPTWAALLRGSPDVATVRLPGMPMDGPGLLAVLDVVAAAAPRLRELDLSDVAPVDSEVTRLITDRFPRLRALRMHRRVFETDDDGDARWWAALTYSHLTLLQFTLPAAPAAAVARAMPWQCMRALGGLQVTAEMVPLLSAGLPCLEKLEACLTGADWPAAPPSRGAAAAPAVSFPSVTWAALLTDAPELAASRGWLAALVPSVERLSWGVRAPRADTDFSPLTRLTRLDVRDPDFHSYEFATLLSGAAWASVASLPQLRLLHARVPV